MKAVKTIVDNSTKLNQPLSPNTSIKSVDAGKYQCWYGQLYESSTQTCTKRNKCQVQNCIMIDDHSNNCKACAKGYIVSADERSCINLNNYPNDIDKNCLYPAEKAQEYRVIRKIQDNLLKEKKQMLIAENFKLELSAQCKVYATEKTNNDVNFYGMGRILKLLAKNKMDGFNIHSLTQDPVCEKRFYRNFRQGECVDANVKVVIDRLALEWDTVSAFEVWERDDMTRFLQQYRTEFIKKNLFKMCRTPFMVPNIPETTCGEETCPKMSANACSTTDTLAQCETKTNTNQKINDKESNKTVLTENFDRLCSNYKKLLVNDQDLSVNGNLTIEEMLKALNWEQNIEMFDFFLLENEDHRLTLDSIADDNVFGDIDVDDHFKFHRCYTEYMDYTNRYIPIIKKNAVAPHGAMEEKNQKANAVLKAFFVYLKKKSFERQGLLRKGYSCDSCRDNIKSSDLKSVHSAIDFMNSEKMHKAYVNNRSYGSNSMENIKSNVITDNYDLFAADLDKLFDFFYTTEEDGTYSVADIKSGEYLQSWMKPFKDLATDWYMLKDEKFQYYRKELPVKLFVRDLLYYQDTLRYIDEKVCDTDGTIKNLKVENLRLSVKDQMFRKWHSKALPEELDVMVSEFVDYSKKEMYKSAIRGAVESKKASCDFTLTQKILGDKAAEVVTGTIFPKLKAGIDKLQTYFSAPWGSNDYKS